MQFDTLCREINLNSGIRENQPLNHKSPEIARKALENVHARLAFLECQKNLQCRLVEDKTN